MYARPGDDAPRFVIGDAWLEAGDPRGELIAEERRRLARGAVGTQPSKLERSLAREHGETWLGELSSVLRAPGFRLGFLSQASMRGGVHASKLLQLRDWKTLERLFLGQIRTDVTLAVLTEAPLDSLRELSSVLVHVIEQVAEAKGPLMWTALDSIPDYGDVEPCGGFDLLAGMHEVLPKLRRLTLASSSMMTNTLDELEVLLKSELASRLEHFELHCDSEAVDDVLELARSRKLKHLLVHAGGKSHSL